MKSILRGRSMEDESNANDNRLARFVPCGAPDQPSALHAEPAHSVSSSHCSVRPPSARLDRLGTRPNFSPPPFSLSSNDSRTPAPSYSSSVSTNPERSCRFGPGASENPPRGFHVCAAIGQMVYQPNTTPAVRARQSRSTAQAIQGG
ncbi:hypothetical protein CI238_01783 [Colletotrichum incanum]|uniref:Uncharacterized protein n=1 Tax=Colletotrichum incanum TaxID=1573173 RepID=A0A161WC33_COLIC|nr:hypothetical protein CI238_01783 [Colletotrichum incanum]